MKPETKEKVMQFIAAHQNGKLFKHEDFQNYKLSYVFFHVMKQLGIIKLTNDYHYFVDVIKFNEITFNGLYEAYNNYMYSKRPTSKKPITRYDQIMNETFKQMPNVFSSYDFCDILAKKGISRKELKTGIGSQFLKKVAVQNGHRSRTWSKKSVQGQLTIHDVSIPVANITTQGAIEHLKKLGYKIMKPINQWEEI